MMFLEAIRDLKAKNLDNQSILNAMQQMVNEGELSQRELEYAIEYLGCKPNLEQQQVEQNPQQNVPLTEEEQEKEQVNSLFGMKIL